MRSDYGFIRFAVYFAGGWLVGTAIGAILGAM